jgi:DUF438 domain-containing protein
MNDPMTILKADHREVKKLLKALTETDEGTERQKLAEQVQLALSVHMQIEEQLLYPIVTELVGEEDAEEAEVEHRLARTGLATMMELVDQPGFGAAVEMVAAGVAHHVEEEESELLPELKDEMERDAWLALGDAIARAKEEAGLPVASPPRRKSAKRSSSKRSSPKSNSSSARKAAAGSK